MFRLLGLQFSWLERLPNRLYIFIVVHCSIMRNLKELTNEELIKTYKEHKCSLKSIEKDFGLGKNAAGRLSTITLSKLSFFNRNFWQFK